MEKKFKIGIALDSLHLAAWKYELIKKLQHSKWDEISLILFPESAKKNWISNFHRSLDAKIFRPFPDAFSKKNLKDLCAQQEMIPLDREGAIPPQIGNGDLDVLVWLNSSEPPASWYKTARYGIWSYRYGQGNSETADAELLAYREFMKKEGATKSALLIRRHPGDFGKIAYESWSRVHSFSLSESQHESIWKMISFLPRALKKLASLGETAFFDSLPEKTSSGRDYAPSPLAISINLAKHGARLFHKTWQKIRFRGQWILMLHRGDGPSHSFTDFKKMIPPKDMFWADPFLIIREGRRCLFLEEYSFASDKAHISVMEMAENGTAGPVIKILDEPYHLSYPFLFEYEGGLYMIPESFEAQKIQVFECTDFPFRWQHKMNLMEGLCAVDTTLFFYNDKWWLFTNIAENKGSSLDDELFLFYAQTPLTTSWKSHPKNPIVSDVRRARPAGNIYVHDGKLIRPSQDCSKVYGYGFNLNEIELLTKTDFREKKILQVSPIWDKMLQRTHTFSHTPGMTVIDGQILQKKGRWWIGILFAGLVEKWYDFRAYLTNLNPFFHKKGAEKKVFPSTVLRKK